MAKYFADNGWNDITIAIPLYASVSERKLGFETLTQ